MKARHTNTKKAHNFHRRNLVLLVEGWKLMLQGKKLNDKGQKLIDEGMRKIDQAILIDLLRIRKSDKKNNNKGVK